MHWLRNIAVTGVAFGGSWSAAIWYWRETNRLPAGSELVLCLLMAPLLLLSLWWLGRKAWARAAAAAPASSGAASATANSPAAADQDAARTAAPALAILATAVRAPHGASVAELRAALAGNQARPQLDSELYDDDGYPILAARLPDAGDDALRATLPQWRRLHQLDDPAYDPAQWRALAAASAVTAELAAQAAQLHDLEPWRTPPHAAPAPVLRLLALWPDNWKPQQCALARQWLRHIASEAGWPVALLAPAEAPAATTAEAADAGATLAALLQHGDAPHHPPLTLLVAAGSQLSDTSIDRLSSQNALYTARQPQGRIPGEGAAALLLATPSAPGAHGASLLQALHTGHRRGSADEARRDSDACLADAVNHTLQAAQLDGAAIALVTADTGHRTSRITELMHVVTAVAPQLDPGADVVSVGASGGSCGDATWITALALAAAEAQERYAPVLCISNEDPYRRYAVLLRPAPAA